MPVQSDCKATELSSTILLCEGMKCSRSGAGMSKCFAPEGVTSRFVAPLRRLVSNCKQNSLKPRSTPSASKAFFLRRAHNRRNSNKLGRRWLGLLPSVGPSLSLKTTSIHPNAVAPSVVKPRSSSHLLFVFPHRSSAASASTTRVARAAIAVAPVTTSRPGWREPSTPGTPARVSGAHAKVTRWHRCHQRCHLTARRSWSWGLSVWGFACSPCVFVGSLQVLRLSPAVQKHM